MSRLKQRRLELNMTLEEVGNIVGVTKTTVRKWETGDIENMKRDKIQLLAKALKTTPLFVMGIDENSETISYPSNIFPIETRKIPLLGTIAAGQPIFAEEAFESYVEIGANIKADFCLRVKGDSMINARILDGDIVFIKKQSDVNNGEIAVVLIDDDATLKRIYKTDKTMTLIAENPTYNPMVFYENDCKSIKIIGKAVAFQSDVK